MPRKTEDKSWRKVCKTSSEPRSLPNTVWSRAMTTSCLAEDWAHSLERVVQEIWLRTSDPRQRGPQRKDGESLHKEAGTTTKLLPHPGARMLQSDFHLPGKD